MQAAYRPSACLDQQFNLAWKLALVHKGLAAPTILSSYQTERLPVVALMLGITSKLDNFAFPDSAASDGGTNAGAES